MTKKEILKSLIREFHHRPLPDFVAREGVIPSDLDKIVTIIGPRRSGKTYRMYQIAAGLLKSHEKQELVFLNFEDERLELAAVDLDLVIQAYRELYPEQDISRCVFFFDEIQNITGWEKFVRRVYDTVSRRIYLSGSNAKMLSSEIATSLRGRSVSFTVLPLSFREYLRFRKITYDPYVPEARARVGNALESYMEYGGFPELVNIADNGGRNRILQEYYQVMLFRDLVDHYQIKNIVALKYFLKRLFSSAAKEISVNRIFNDLKSANIKIGKNTLYSFLDYAESIFLAGTLKKFSPRLSAREFGERKIYIVDTGLLNAVVYKFTEDRGKAAEQIVYWELKRRFERIFFVKNGFECDFVIISPDGQVRNAIQVCMDLSDPSTRKRETRGLVAACRRLNLDRGTIISYDEQEEFVADGVRVSVYPLERFLCEAVA